MSETWNEIVLACLMAATIAYALSAWIEFRDRPARAWEGDDPRVLHDERTEGVVERLRKRAGC